eukprot:349534-Prymnesium_polylepis.1
MSPLPLEIPSRLPRMVHDGCREDVTGPDGDDTRGRSTEHTRRVGVRSESPTRCVRQRRLPPSDSVMAVWHVTLLKMAYGRWPMLSPEA